MIDYSFYLIITHFSVIIYFYSVHFTQYYSNRDEIIDFPDYNYHYHDYYDYCCCCYNALHRSSRFAA